MRNEGAVPPVSPQRLSRSSQVPARPPPPPPAPLVLVGKPSKSSLPCSVLFSCIKRGWNQGRVLKAPESLWNWCFSPLSPQSGAQAGRGWGPPLAVSPKPPACWPCPSPGGKQTAPSRRQVSSLGPSCTAAGPTGAADSRPLAGDLQRPTLALLRPSAGKEVGWTSGLRQPRGTHRPLPLCRAGRFTGHPLSARPWGPQRPTKVLPPPYPTSSGQTGRRQQGLGEGGERRETEVTPTGSVSPLSGPTATADLARPLFLHTRGSRCLPLAPEVLVKKLVVF